MTASKLFPLPEPAGFSSGTHDGALFTLKRSTGKNFAKGALQPLCEWYSADQMRAYAAAAVAAERERWRSLLEEALEADTNDYMFGSDLADRMRAALKT